MCIRDSDLGEKNEIYKSFQSFTKQFEKILKNNPKVEIFLRADKETLYDNVARTMSLIKKFKTDSINLITEPIDNE